MDRQFIRAGFLAQLIPAISSEETRFYLQGVYVDASGVLVATDGHVMGVVRPTPGVDCSLGFFEQLAGKIIRLPKPSELKDFRASFTWVGISQETGALSVFQGKQTWDQFASQVDAATPTHIAPGSCYIGGTFPDWKRVVPRACDHAGTGDCALGTAVLNQVQAFFGAPKQSWPIAFFHARDKKTETHDGGPLIARGNGQPDSFLVLVPMRPPEGRKLASALPDWFK